MSRAPIINGTRKLPSVVGIDGIRNSQTIDHAVDREQAVVNVSLRRTRSLAGVSSSSRISVAATPPMKKNDRHDREQVQHRDALVIAREAATSTP